MLSLCCSALLEHFSTVFLWKVTSTIEVNIYLCGAIDKLCSNAQNDFMLLEFYTEANLSIIRRKAYIKSRAAQFTAIKFKMKFVTTTSLSHNKIFCHGVLLRLKPILPVVQSFTKTQLYPRFCSKLFDFFFFISLPSL